MGDFDRLDERSKTQGKRLDGMSDNINDLETNLNTLTLNVNTLAGVVDNQVKTNRVIKGLGGAIVIAIVIEIVLRYV